MDRAALLLRLLAALCLVSLLLAGCAGLQRRDGQPEASEPVSRAQVAHEVRRESHEAPPPLETGHTLPPPPPKQVPITLDALLRIAEQSNAKIGQAREKLRESEIRFEQAHGKWMPNVYAVMGYYRHEGGVQDFDGRIIHSSTGVFYPGMKIQGEWDVREITFQQLDAERKVWQQKAELSRVNNEVLLEAATTYVDLLTARRGEALVREMERYERKLLSRARELAKVEASLDTLIEGLRSSLEQREFQAAQLNQQGNAASAKLVYLLGLPPSTILVPADPVLVPVELMDTTPPTEVLVDQTMNYGPGVQELLGLMNTIQRGLDMSYSKRNLLPTVEVCLWEGLISGGPGGSTKMDNRFDATLLLKWNITDILRAEDKRKIARSQLEQTRWALTDVQQRLAASVQESKDTILNSRRQLGHGLAQIKHANESYRLADNRVEKGVRGSSPTEVVTAIRLMEASHFNYVQAIRDHNKAQVRLLLLAGHGPANEKKLANEVQAAPPTPAHSKKGEPEKLPPPMPGDDGKERKEEKREESRGVPLPVLTEQVKTIRIDGR